MSGGVCPGLVLVDTSGYLLQCAQCWSGHHTDNIIQGYHQPHCLLTNQEKTQ